MSELITKDTSHIIKAELDTQISTAKAYPRDTKRFLQEAIAMATIDEDTAASCFYCLVRKNKDGERNDIRGPSIRLGEIVASCWGNLHAASRIIGNDGKKITAEGVAWDLEKNVKMSSEVQRSIVTSKGMTYSSDMQIVTGNAACSIALRNVIFKTVPKTFVDRVYNEARKFAVGDQKTLTHKRKAVFERLKAIGISEEKVLPFFNKQKIDEFSLEDIEQLIGIGTAIKEGLLKIDDAFVIDEESQGLSVTERINKLVEGKNNKEK